MVFSKEEYGKKYYKEHKEEIKKRAKEWAKENLEKYRKLMRAGRLRYEKNHPERVQKTNYLWRKNNPEKVKEINKRRHKKLMENPKAYLRDRIRHRADRKIKIDGLLCYDCKKKKATTRHHEKIWLYCFKE